MAMMAWAYSIYMGTNWCPCRNDIQLKEFFQITESDSLRKIACQHQLETAFSILKFQLKLGKDYVGDKIKLPQNKLKIMFPDL